MTGLLSQVFWEVRLQYRNGFYAAALTVVALLSVFLLSVPPEVRVWLLPLSIFSNLSINAFYFTGAIVLLNKGERTLEVLAVTPLKPALYLTSLAISLTVLSLVENLVLTTVAQAVDVNYGYLSLGITMFSVFLVLYGFWVVIRYDSVNQYLFPSFLFTMPLSVPFLDFFDLWSSPLLYLFPSMPPMVVFKAAFFGVGIVEIIFAVVTGVFWILLIGWLDVRAFRRFVREPFRSRKTIRGTKG